MQALLSLSPALRAIPALPLCELPTPITEHTVDGRQILVKRDDLTSATYGGNKVRKLSFLLADLQARGIRRLSTIGAIGSNHCLATAVHGVASGFEVEIRHIPQPVTAHVRDNLLALSTLPVALKLSGGPVAAGLGVAVDHAVKTGWGFVPAGGSNALGSLGYVDAALEMARQLKVGDLAPPDGIFVALGSGGTLAGLLLGLRLAGLDIPVFGIRVVPGPWVGPAAVARLANAAGRRLVRLDAALARPPLRPSDVRVDDGQLGTGYGHPTASGRAAAAVMESLGLTTELTYTAKAFAGMLDAVTQGGCERPLFWQTLNGADLAEVVGSGDASRLPPAYQTLLAQDPR